MLDLPALSQQCAPTVHPDTMAAIVRVESSGNPHAIGVVGARLQRQPSSQAEAVATAQALEMAGHNFSLGLAQINRHNLAAHGLDYERAFDPCANLRAAAQILGDCYRRATQRIQGKREAFEAALSCYYSGNFRTGLREDIKGRTSYVQRVLGHRALASSPASPKTPTTLGAAVEPFKVTARTPGEEPPPPGVFQRLAPAQMVYR